LYWQKLKMDSLEKLATWANPLIEKLSPNERTRLLKQLALLLRRLNQQRITKQVTPNGEKFTPRRNVTNKTPLFAKLKKNRHIKARSTPHSATVSFIGRAGFIASVHHHGLEDYIEKPGPKIKYPTRELLGFSPQDEAEILNFFTRQLSPER